MLQLAFGLGVDRTNPSDFANFLRTLFATFDKVVYTLIEVVYSILFNIADQDILAAETVKAFYGRVQLIIGVVMIFKLSISVLQVIVNPDLMTDQKKGLGKVISRVLVMLAMFVAIIPLNIPADHISSEHSYNQYLNDDGLLFGTLYSLQYRVLHNNTIAKLILGTDDKSYNVETEDNSENIENAKVNGSKLSAYLIKSFLSINLKSDADSKGIENSDNYVCTGKINDESETIVETISKSLIRVGTIPFLGPVGSVITGNLFDILKGTSDANKVYAVWNSGSASDILDMVNVSCDDGGYAFSYFPIVSTICGILILVIFIGFCLDVAIRTLKLVILRLIAPIAIISYIDPQSSEKGAFANWVKLLVSTYVDLFIRLAIIFFSMSIVMGIIDNGFNLRFSSGVIGTLSVVVIIIAVFYFAKETPKFIMDALGIKGMGFGVGLSGILGGIGALVGGGGLAGMASGFMNASTQAAEAASQGKQAPPAYSSQRDKVTQMLTGDKDARGGLLGNATKAMNDRANNRMIRRNFGIDRNMVGRAKNEMYDLKSAASGAEEAYKRFVQGNMTDAEITDIEGATAFNDYLAANGIHYATLSADDRRRTMQEYLEHDWSNKQTAAAKQEAWYNEGSKILEAFNVNETFQEKYSSNRRRVDNWVNAHDASRIARAVGSVAGSAGQRRSNRLNRHGDGYVPPTARDYGVSHQHRADATVGRDDHTNV